MVKKFTAQCDFNGQKRPFTLYIGQPNKGAHPLAFQSKWLAKNYLGKIPQDIMDAFKDIASIAEKNKVPFDDLCSYVIDQLNLSESLASDFSQGSALSAKNDEDSEDDEDDVGDDKTTKPAKTSKMQKGSTVIEQGANPLKQEQILREKYSANHPENAGSDPGEKSFKPQNPTMIEENGALKPKRKKGEAPIADEGMQSPLKHKRDDARFNPNASSLKKNADQQKKLQQNKVQQDIKSSSNQGNYLSEVKTPFSFYSKSNTTHSTAQKAKAEAALPAKDNNTKYQK